MIKLIASLIILVTTTLPIAGCMSSNHPPLISSLTASASRVSPSGNCQVKCAASDLDEDKLNYTWSAYGDISGEGAAVTWTAPATLGDYTITVKVTDGRGGEATAQLTISVTDNHPPVIDSLTSEWQQVKKAMSTTINCTARDPDEDKLSYLWSASGGNISGEGAVVTWVAPDAFGTYTITITVNDGRGGQATQSIDIEVTCCPTRADLQY